MNDLDTLRSALADRYEIHEELGAGAMARVFRAKDLKHDRDLALKVFRPELRVALGVDRFLNEIEVTAGLSHPHILPLFDSGDEGGMLYYVTVFVEGGTLRDRIQREHKLSVDDTVRLRQFRMV